MNLIDLGGPLQAFSTANRLISSPKKPAYRMITVSLTGGLIRSAAGLELTTKKMELLRLQTIDTLIVPGGFLDETPHIRDGIVKWVQRANGVVRRICSVCTGAFVLAEGKILNGRRATTHWHWADDLKERYPLIEVDADPIFIQDGPVWTSAGVTAGIDLSLALIEQDFGHRAAIRTARHLVMFMKRPGGQSQFSIPLISQFKNDKNFVDLHAWIVDNLHRDLTVEKLARQAGMSIRTFARLYPQKIGRTPSKTVELMRLEAATRALEETELPMKTIAVEVGFREEQNLRRVMKRTLGISPGEYRARFAPSQSQKKCALLKSRLISAAGEFKQHNRAAKAVAGAD